MEEPQLQHRVPQVHQVPLSPISTVVVGLNTHLLGINQDYLVSLAKVRSLLGLLKHRVDVRNL